MESTAQDCGERLQKFFVAVIIQIHQLRDCFGNCWKVGYPVVTMPQLPCSTPGNNPFQQSISTSEHLVWHTCSMNIQLNTWIQALAGKSKLLLPFSFYSYITHSFKRTCHMKGRVALILKD